MAARRVGRVARSGIAHRQQVGHRTRRSERRDPPSDATKVPIEVGRVCSNGLGAGSRSRGGAMSVRMTLTVTADPKQLEQFASGNREKMQGVLEAAKRHGLIAHRFFGSDDGGSLMVLDEWPDRQSFESFFHEQESQIRPMMEAAGATSEPKPSFWHQLATHDEFGWGA